MTFVWKLINMHIDSYGEQTRGMEVGVVIKPLPPANYALTSPLPRRHMGTQYLSTKLLPKIFTIAYSQYIGLISIVYSQYNGH